MSTGAVVIGLLLVALLAAWVLLPILRGAVANTPGLVNAAEKQAEGGQQRQYERQHERLQVYYARAVRNLRDLEEDYALGKLDEAAYATDRAYWSDRGVAALKAIDALNTLTVVQRTHVARPGEPAVPEAIAAVSGAAEADAGISTPVLALNDGHPTDDAALDTAIEDAIEQAVRQYREQQA